MNCPQCGSDSNKVTDSRASAGGKAIRRRRHCLSCPHRWTTYEMEGEPDERSITPNTFVQQLRDLVGKVNGVVDAIERFHGPQ